MRNVYVAGIGITTFGRLEYPLTEVAAYPAMMAMQHRTAGPRRGGETIQSHLLR